MNVFIIGLTGGIGGLLAQILRSRDEIVFSAGSNGGSKEVTKAIDGDGVGKTIEATPLAAVERFALVSIG